MEETAEKVRAAEENLERCTKLRQGRPPKPADEPLHQIGRELQAAYKLLRGFHIQDGMSALQVDLPHLSPKVEKVTHISVNPSGLGWQIGIEITKSCPVKKFIHPSDLNEQ